MSFTHEDVVREILRARLVADARRIQELRARVAELEGVNHSAAVCAEHVGEFVGDGCLVCQNIVLRAVAEAAKWVHAGAPREGRWSALDDLAAALAAAKEAGAL